MVVLPGVLQLAGGKLLPGEVYVWRDVEICGRLLRRHMARWESNWSVGRWPRG